MNPISATSSNTQSRWNYYKDLASIVCSRESTYRTALDITAFDFPSLVADAFRGPKKFIETFVEGLSAVISIGASPYINAFIAKVLAKFILPKEMQKDALHCLRFNMPELRNFEVFKESKKRLIEEEVEDKNFIASLYKRANKTEKSDAYEKEAKNIKEFCDKFNPTEEKMNFIYKLKKATIIGESFIEGGIWGGFGLYMRAFRKYILGEGRFTGTKGYVSDAESEQLGESGELNLFQKLWGGICIFIAPVMNTILLNKVEDEKAVKKSWFLQKVKDNFDLTHGVYPKLGLLFSLTSYPKWLGVIGTAQGNFERVERLLKLITVLPSWWLGHRVTNGVCALNADKKLAKTYNVKPGILVEPKYLEQTVNNDDTFFERIQKRFPEPAKIHHVFTAVDKTDLDKARKEELKFEAEDKHARCLYKGFTMHSLGVFAINMAVNYSTKLRALWALRN